MKKIKKPRTVSDGEAHAMLHVAGLRRVQTATYASHALALKIQALKGTAVPLDAEEAARKFWDRKTNVASALEDACLVSAVPEYSEALQPTVDALTSVCDHIVGSMEGWDVPAPEAQQSEDTADSLSKSTTSLHSVVGQKQARAAAASDQPKLMQQCSGTAGYVTEMKKASGCVGGEAPSVKIIPDVLKQGNTQAAKFLELLKGQPIKRSTELPGVRTGQVEASLPGVLAQWASRNTGQNEQPTDGTQRPWPVLAGPAFSPQNWFQGSSLHPKVEAVVDTRQPPEKAASQGPDVSGFPRPSDKLAFAHLEETENADDMRMVRKPAQEFLDENLLRSMPVKVIYTAREGMHTLENNYSLNAGGSASVRYTTFISRMTSFPTVNPTDRMKAHMQEIQENAVLMQGLRRKSNLSPSAAMRTLILQASTGLNPGCGRPSEMFEQDQSNLLMMHPALEKVSSVKEDRPGGLQARFTVDSNMPASLGTRAIS